MIRCKESFFAICIYFSLFFSNTSAFASEIDPKYNPTDIQKHWAYDQLNDLVDSDIVNGYENNTIKPDSPITRAEFAQMVVNAVSVNTLERANQQDKNFSDVSPDQWFYKPVHLLASIGYVNGTDPDHFQPNRNIHRDEMAKMVQMFFK